MVFTLIFRFFHHDNMQCVSLYRTNQIFLCPATFRLQLRRRRRRQREGRRRQKRFLRVGRPMIYGLREGKKTLPDDRFLRQKRQINVKIQAWSEGCGSGTWAQCG